MMRGAIKFFKRRACYRMAGRYILVQDLEENYEELCLKRADGAKAASEYVTRQIDDLGGCVT
jgi:hypothetical protein